MAALLINIQLFTLEDKCEFKLKSTEAPQIYYFKEKCGFWEKENATY